MHVLLTWLILFFSVAFLYVYHSLKKSYAYFQEASIPTITPLSAFVNTKEFLWMKKPLVKQVSEAYLSSEPHQLFGNYNLFSRSIMIREPELIKRILVKDFSYFQHHGTEVYKDIEPLACHLFNLKGEEWRSLRMKMTGIFTSGKMKKMFPLVGKCAEEMKSALIEYVSNPEGFEVRELCSRYTTDVIGSCAFGVDTNSFKNPHSEFRKMGARVFEFRWKLLIRLMTPKMPPWCVKFFGMEMFSKDVMDYFMKITKDMVKYREENNVTRGDFLDLLIALKNQTETEEVNNPQETADLNKSAPQVGENRIRSDIKMTVELVAAQCFLFIAGGFEGASVALSFLLYELAQHPQIQNKLRQEIISSIENNGGELKYDMLKNLSYLNMVLQVMRLHAPNGGVILRQCNENYKIPETGTTIGKGTQVIIPLSGLHSDEKYYEKPDEFYPEHFTKEAISRRPHFAYLPFGEGPRICIAERFANMQILIAAVHLIKDFSFELSPKTVLPLEFLPSVFTPKVKGGIWLKCKPL
ncbi:probable cytochrome P450 6a14 isoform X2 [Planococcus citri]|uniref:probable cytochrome P450 6a14 isoform X2 n=1 Tax=Planococcus citri TaxID=170843 RepID=UPI0031F747D6